MLSQIDARKFNTLIEIINLISSHRSGVNALLTRILDSAMRLCEGDASSLLLVDKPKGLLRFEVALGAKGPEVKRYSIKLGEGIAGWVALHNRSIIVNDVENDARHLRAIADEIDYPSKTMLAVPMRVQDECIGVIELINKKNGAPFTAEDREWLEIFAAQAGIALTNARNIEQARDEIELLQDQVKSAGGYHTLIAKSPVILKKLAVIDRIAATSSSVLILGESGCGKEIFAEQIHLRSPRREKPFVRVNCAALPEGLLESELFGHVKGAFTSAVAARQGRFEQAAGGTIFLDEIGDLPLSLQAKLLRVIQEKTFEKLGGENSTTVDVRILAATNRDIEEQVRRGEFRQDLYYRLNVLPLYIPPLRERGEDIPELADFFLKRCMSETKKRFAGFSQEAMEAMLTYSWPGNIRELENCVERACVIGKGEWIEAADLFLQPSSQAIAGGGGEGWSAGKTRPLRHAINAFKTRYIGKALEEHNWHQTETARALGIQRTYLSRLIKELEIKT